VGWQPGLDYLRLDGKTSGDERDQMVKQFNARDSAIRLFLISTKAGGLGLNLASASRVILFDASWNPSSDVQAVFRAYRYGQRRTVYVYRLIAQGFEECLYRQQVVKLQLAGHIIDDTHAEAMYTEEELKAYYAPLPAVDAVAGASDASRPGADLATESWLPALAQSGQVGPLLASVEDHDALRLGEAEELLTVREMEDAANELLEASLDQPRDLTFCDKCNAQLHKLSYKQFGYRCGQCGHDGLVPPAPPVVTRNDPTTKLAVEPRSITWKLHGESGDKSAINTTVLATGGAYHVQWRVAPVDEEGNALQLGENEGWTDAKKPISGGRLIAKKQIDHTVAYQARVRARMSACSCSLSSTPLAFVTECRCPWTPWSPPSVKATPTAPDEEPAA